MNRREFALGLSWSLGSLRPRALESNQDIPNATGLYVMPEERLPYSNSIVTPLGNNEYFDAEGVKIYWVGDNWFNHPVGQSQYALRMMNSFRLTGDDRYLAAAKRNVRRLLSRVIEQGGNLYFPYEFDFRLHQTGDNIMRAPWFSGMAQGQALSALIRLADVSPSDELETAIAKTASSFKPINNSSFPWSPTTDTDGYLWIEEYPGEEPCMALNGHLFGTFGLYEYWMKRGDEGISDRILDAVAMVKAKVGVFRQELASSLYCLGHKDVNTSYHQVHMAQLLTLYSLTHDSYFAQMSDLLFDDYPFYQLQGRIAPERGTYEVFQIQKDYKFASASTSINVDKEVEWKLMERRTSSGSKEAFYKILDENDHQYWVREDARILLRGAYLGRVSDNGPFKGTQRTYYPARNLRLLEGMYTGYQASGIDFLYPALNYTLTGNMMVRVAARQLIDGKDHVLVESESDQLIWLQYRNDLMQFE